MGLHRSQLEGTAGLPQTTASSPGSELLLWAPGLFFHVGGGPQTLASGTLSVLFSSWQLPPFSDPGSALLHLRVGESVQVAQLGWGPRVSCSHSPAPARACLYVAPWASGKEISSTQLTTFDLE